MSRAADVAGVNQWKMESSLVGSTRRDGWRVQLDIWVGVTGFNYAVPPRNRRRWAFGGFVD